VEDVDKLPGVGRQLFAALLPDVPPGQLTVPAVRVEPANRRMISIQLLARDLSPAEPGEKSLVESLLVWMFLDLAPKERHGFGLLLIFGSKRGDVSLEHAAIRCHLAG